jgi:hypothetical protein
MKALRAIGFLILGVVVLAVLLVALTLILNRKDEPPSAAAQRLEKILESRPDVPAAENAVVYALGFDAPPSMDPVQLGTERTQWLESLAYDGELAGSDPAADLPKFVDSALPGLTRLRQTCSEDDRRGCAEIFDLLASVWQPDELQQLALNRYRELIRRRAWREVLPIDQSMPLPHTATSCTRKTCTTWSSHSLRAKAGSRTCAARWPRISITGAARTSPPRA